MKDKEQKTVEDYKKGSNQGKTVADYKGKRPQPGQGKKITGVVK